MTKVFVPKFRRKGLATRSPRLPIKILEHIIGHSAAKEQLAFALTCKALRPCAQAYLSYARPFSEVGLAHLLKDLRSSPHLLRFLNGHLALDMRAVADNPHIDFSSLRILSEALDSVAISGWTRTRFDTILSHLGSPSSSLTRLELESCSMQLAHLQHLVYSIPSLHELSFHHLTVSGTGILDIAHLRLHSISLVHSGAAADDWVARSLAANHLQMLECIHGSSSVLPLLQLSRKSLTGMVYRFDHNTWLHDENIWLRGEAWGQRVHLPDLSQQQALESLTFYLHKESHNSDHAFEWLHILFLQVNAPNLRQMKARMSLGNDCVIRFQDILHILHTLRRPVFQHLRIFAIEHVVLPWTEDTTLALLKVLRDAGTKELKCVPDEHKDIYLDFVRRGCSVKVFDLCSATELGVQCKCGVDAYSDPVLGEDGVWRSRGSCLFVVTRGDELHSIVYLLEGSIERSRPRRPESRIMRGVRTLGSKLAM